MKIVEFFHVKDEPTGPIPSTDNECLMYSLYIRKNKPQGVIIKFTGVILSVHPGATFGEFCDAFSHENELKNYISELKARDVEFFNEENDIMYDEPMADNFFDEKILIKLTRKSEVFTNE